MRRAPAFALSVLTTLPAGYGVYELMNDQLPSTEQFAQERQDVDRCAGKMSLSQTTIVVTLPEECKRFEDQLEMVIPDLGSEIPKEDQNYNLPRREDFLEDQLRAIDKRETSRDAFLLPVSVIGGLIGGMLVHSFLNRQNP